MSLRDKPAPRPSRLRRLSDEEIELWRQVATTVVRRPGASLPAAHVAASSVPIASPPKVVAKGVAKAAPKTAPKPQPYAAPYTPPPQVVAPKKMAPLERKLKQRLSRGRIGADAAIDLHGFRAAEALSALRHFLVQAQAEGARVVLVVTGKGGGAGDPFDMTGGSVGVLKRSVPLWLAQPDFRAIVIGFEEAGRPHGGAGALYVRLRRRG